MPDPDSPSDADRFAADFRRRNAGRWIAWTRGFGNPVAAAATRDEVKADAARAGYEDVISEWVPPWLGIDFNHVTSVTHSAVDRATAIAEARRLGDPSAGEGWRRLLWRMADLLEAERKNDAC